MARIAISPSDQPHNPYASGGTNERDAMHAVAAVTVECLREAGHTVLLCTRGDGQPNSYAQHAREANDWGADWYVAVHSNAGGGRGTETHAMGPDVDPQGWELARAVQRHVAAVSSASDRGVHVSRQLAEVNIPKAPCCLVEVAFHDNAVEAAEILAKVTPFGRAVAAGIIEVAGQPAPAPTRPPAPRTTGVAVLQRGATGPAVFDWQTFLMAYFPRTHGATVRKTGGADSSYGPGTELATKGFQRACTQLGQYRGAIDGVRGPLTYECAHKFYSYRGK